MDAQEFLDQPVFVPGPTETTAASISRIFKHFSSDAIGTGIAVVTADRGDRAFKLDENGVVVVDKQRNAALNNKARQRLEGVLKTQGLRGYIKVKGGFQEHGSDVVSYENSYVVPSVSLEDAIKLAKTLGEGAALNFKSSEEKLKNPKSLQHDFRQESILWGSNKSKALLLNYKGKVDFKLGKTFEPDTANQFFTEWRGRRFTFRDGEKVTEGSVHTIEYIPTSPSDFRQWRSELVKQCLAT